MEINSENYEEVMFRLLEKEFESEVEEDILFEIEKDPFLNFEWKQMQKTKIEIDVEPYHLGEIDFWKSLQKEEKEKAFILPYTQFKNILRVAAVFLLFGTLLTVYLYNSNKNSNPQIAQGKEQKTNPNPASEKPAPTNEIEPRNLVGTRTNSEKLAQNEVQDENILVDVKNNSLEKAAPFTPTQKTIIPVVAVQNIDTFKTKEADPVIEIVKENEVIVAVMDSGKNKPVIAPQRYAVTQVTESLDIRQLAMLSGFEKYNISAEEERQINQFLSDKKVRLAQLLQDTKIRLKRKDDKIILLAQGKDESTLVWKISN